MRLRPRVRVDLLSGFLGSGKTTLMRNHLAAVKSDRVAVVINEYGAVSIDHRLVRHGQDGLLVLANGCACCAVAHQLRSVLLELLQEDASHGGRLVDRVLIETSGLADPASIINTLRADENLAEYLEPGSCVVTFDTLVGVRSLESYVEVQRQLAAADTIVLTKADLASKETLKDAEARVALINPFAVRHVSATTSFSAEGLFLTRANAQAPHPHLAGKTAEHAPGIRSFALRLDADVDWASFSIWLTCLLNRHGSRILRFKGILESSSHPRPLVIHGVHHLVYPPQHLDSGARRGYSDLVFIVEDLDQLAVERSLRAFFAFAASVIRIPVPARSETPIGSVAQS